jgi:hypothetical protein
MIDPPVRIPGQPFGSNGCQFFGCTIGIENPTNSRMATIFRSTITLFVSADSRIPRTRTTVSSMTIMNAGQLNPKCHPGA